jgi:hypothetical protein
VILNMSLSELSDTIGKLRFVAQNSEAGFSVWSIVYRFKFAQSPSNIALGI